MEKIINNCGLIALREISNLENISAKTLISLAKDNGLCLNTYKVPKDKICKVNRPAIFQTPNHFVYIDSEKNLPELDYTGVVLSLENQSFDKIENVKELELINGATWIACGVAVVGLATAGVGAYSSSTTATASKNASASAVEQARILAEQQANANATALEIAKINSLKTQKLITYGAYAVGGLLFVLLSYIIFKPSKSAIPISTMPITPISSTPIKQISA